MRKHAIGRGFNPCTFQLIFLFFLLSPFCHSNSPPSTPTTYLRLHGLERLDGGQGLGDVPFRVNLGVEAHHALPLLADDVRHAPRENPEHVRRDTEALAQVVAGVRHDGEG